MQCPGTCGRWVQHMCVRCGVRGTRPGPAAHVHHRGGGRSRAPPRPALARSARGAAVGGAAAAAARLRAGAAHPPGGVCKQACELAIWHSRAHAERARSKYPRRYLLDAVCRRRRRPWETRSAARRDEGEGEVAQARAQCWTSSCYLEAILEPAGRALPLGTPAPSTDGVELTSPCLGCISDC